MFLDVLLGVLPLFLIMLVGYAASHSARFADNVEPALNVFVFYIALPALLYQVVATADISGGVPPAFLWGVACSTLAFAMLTWLGFRYLIRMRPAPALAAVLTTGFGNVSYLGIPVVLGVLGPGAGLAAGMGQLVHNMIFMVGFPVVAQLMLPAGAGHARKPSPGRMLRTARNALIYNPVTWAMILGGAVLAWQVRVLGPVTSAIDMLAAAAAPGALFTIGLSLRRTVLRLRRSRRIQTNPGTRLNGSSVSMVVMVAGKLLLLPLLTVVTFGLIAPHMDAQWFNAAVLMAAMPTSATAYIMAQADTGDGEPTALAIVVTCTLSVLSLPALAQLFLR